MNNFSSDYGNPEYTPRHSIRSPPRRTHANKHTNTPTEFMTCHKCQEKLTKKTSQQCNSCEVGDCNRNMLEYSKALNYINSCHTIINQMMKQTKDSGEFLKMPDLPNFVELFNSFANLHCFSGDVPAKPHKRPHESRYKVQPEDRSRCNLKEEKPRVYQSKQSAHDDQLRTATKGKYIELLPNMKQDYKNPELASPGTTESEESDFDLQLQKTGRMVIPNKYKTKIRTSCEKVIYEEDSVDDESVKASKKKDSQVIQNGKEDSKKPSPSTRSVLNSPAAQRSKPSSPISFGTPTSTDRKVKQRSSSSATPRERTKVICNKKVNAQDVAGNFSDTAITGQMKKAVSKTLSTPMNLRTSELSQQDLDKYAKELLGSETPTPGSPRSKSPISSSYSQTTTKPKTEEKNKKLSKLIPPTPSARTRIPDPKKRSYSDRLQLGNTNTNGACPKVSSVASPIMRQEPQSNQQQPQQEHQQPKKYKKKYEIQQPVEQNAMKKQISCRKSSNVCGNSNGSGPPQNQCKMNCYSFGSVTSHSDNSYSRNRQEKHKDVQEDDDDDNKSSCKTNDIEDGNGSSPEQLNLLCDNTETLSMHCRLQNSKQLVSTPKAQYAVTSKPNDFFTLNRKSSVVRKRCSKHEIEDELVVESDEIKTDSDIEEDHFDKTEETNLSRKSSKASGPNIQMSHVLSHLGLLPNGQMPPETEQMINDAKSTRANDERNRPFREPRKSNEEETERIMKIEDNRMGTVYQTESLTQIRTAVSDDSSDIKSDEELYNSKIVPFNYCLGNGRYQS